MLNHTGKTKTAMLLELESIKDLLVEDDDIPTLEEVVLEIPDSAESRANLAAQPLIDEEIIVLDYQTDAATPQVLVDTLTSQPIFYPIPDKEEQVPTLIEMLDIDAETIDIKSINIAPDLSPSSEKVSPIDSPSSKKADESSPVVQSPAYTSEQQDFFPLAASEELPKVTAGSTTNPNSPLSTNQPMTSTTPFVQPPTPIKAASQNPFLPEHIRARLQGNNTSSSTAENKVKTSNVSHLSSVSNSNFTAPTSLAKKTNLQQQLLDEIVAKVLPQIEKELRGRLGAMSKSMLEDFMDDCK